MQMQSLYYVHLRTQKLDCIKIAAFISKQEKVETVLQFLHCFITTGLEYENLIKAPS